MHHLRSYRLAVEFHHAAKNSRLPGYLSNQCLRASSSTALNLAEGSGKKSVKDQVRFFSIAFGSIRECQAIVDLEPKAFNAKSINLLDHLAASVYKLIHP